MTCNPAKARLRLSKKVRPGDPADGTLGGCHAHSAAGVEARNVALPPEDPASSTRECRDIAPGDAGLVHVAELGGDAPGGDGVTVLPGGLTNARPPPRAG